MPPPVAIAQLLLLRFSLAEDASFRFFHAPTVYAFMHARLGTRPDEPFPPGVRLLAPESGRIRYRAGDAYHVGVALFATAPLSARELIRRLATLSTRASLAGTPLGPRTRLTRVTDLTTGRDVSASGEPGVYTRADLERAAAELASARTLRIRMDSPLLVLRQPVQRRDTFMDGDACDPAVLFDRIGRAAAEALPAFADAPPLPQVALRENHLVRAETYYRGTGGRYATGSVLPGSVGALHLELDAPLGSAWAERLLLAGAYGIGKSTSMGQGRFHVVGAPIHPAWPPRAASTFCERMAREATLASAREALRQAGTTPGVDGVGPEDFLDALTYRLPLLRDALRTGEHQPAPLRGLLLAQDDGVRTLAVPTLEDRFLQRAAMEELGPALDELLEEASFAYRRGLSRRNAEQHVRRAHDDGFRHVLDADLRSFFERVDWSILRQRLSAYLGDDPAVDLLMRWVQAPVEFGDELLPRTRGLPQGAVISPLLANLYLDAFDELMAAEGFRLVRYADDFVVLCKTEADVARAQQVVQQKLAQLRLELAAEKTQVTSFARGFEFLGYVFAHSLVLPQQPKPREARLLRGPEDLTSLGPLTPDKAKGWLVEWLSHDAAPPADRPSFAPALAPTSPARRSVYVVERGLRLSGSQRGLRVYDGDKLLDEPAWSTLSEIAVLGQRAIGPSLFQQAMRHRVPVALYTRGGKPLGVVLPDRVRAPSPSTRAQWRWAEDADARLRIARALIEAKLHNQRLLARHQAEGSDALRERLSLLQGQASRAERSERLRGIEGMAAHAYFAEFRRWIPEEFGFAGRTGRGAHDPINALLNLLYTLLFQRCTMACVAHGLDAYLGVLHEGRDRYAALAADLQEPFRFLCDRLVLDLVHRRRLSPQDFVREEKPSPQVRLRPEALKLVLGEWEKRLEARVRGASGEAHTYRQHILTQAARFASVVAGERQTLDPFRLKW